MCGLLFLPYKNLSSSKSKLNGKLREKMFIVYYSVPNAYMCGEQKKCKRFRLLFMSCSSEYMAYIPISIGKTKIRDKRVKIKYIDFTQHVRNFLLLLCVAGWSVCIIILFCIQLNFRLRSFLFFITLCVIFFASPFFFNYSISAARNFI